MAAQFKKHFSIEEARAMLPELRRKFTGIRELILKIRKEQEMNEQERLRILRGNGKGPILVGAGPHIADVQKHIDSIVSKGIQIKDLERGLIDFPHYLGGDSGHEVLLCFEMSDTDLLYWHEIDEGFGGRQPL